MKRAWITAFEGSFLIPINGYLGRCYKADRRNMDVFLSLFPNINVQEVTLYELYFEMGGGRATAITHLTLDSLRETLMDLATRGLDLSIVEGIEKLPKEKR